MDYQITRTGVICQIDDDGLITLLPPENNGTPEWKAYLAWLAEGNTPDPAPAPPAPPELTPHEKLKRAGLTVDELKALLAD